MTFPEAPASPAPPARPSPGPLVRGYQALVSPRLAIALLVAVLACCVVGVTAFSYERAWALIFTALWFNALLVLLALSAGAAFFSRIWRRKLTVVSVGMILFHLSFMALLGGVVVNGLLHFRGTLRLTEGETLPNGQPESYDQLEHGRLFDFRRLSGETTLVRMHRGYKVGGQDKRAAYEIAVGQGEKKRQHVIYITEYFDDDGVRYFSSKEGYSVLVVLHDAQGQEIYGAHLPLQSILQGDGSRLYTTGTASESGSIAFPQPPDTPRFELQVSYFPSAQDRSGQVALRVAPLGSAERAAASAGADHGGGLTPPGHVPAPAPPPAGKAGEARAPDERKALVPVGGSFDLGDTRLEAREIRYWVSMDVRYDPGLNFSLGSLVTGLLGMTLTLVGRLRQGARKKAA